jgi:PIN domain nuclease of toxin-antitoxin system
LSQPVLLDTNALLWSGNAVIIRPDASIAIPVAQATESLFACSISVWELTFAARKRHLPSRPDLCGKTPGNWFDDAVQRLGATVLDIDTATAAEAAEIALNYGSGDPGDCFLLAIAHIRNMTLVTRDARIVGFARDNPDYLSVIQC